MREESKLRKKLRDYFGTAMTAGMGPATENLREIENATDEELEEIAEKNGIEVSDDDGR